MQAGYNNADGQNNVFIGYRAGYNETGSNKLYISNGSTLIYGDFSSGNLSLGQTSGTVSILNALSVAGEFTLEEQENDNGTLTWNGIAVGSEGGKAHLPVELLNATTLLASVTLNDSLTVARSYRYYYQLILLTQLTCNQLFLSLVLNCKWWSLW